MAWHSFREEVDWLKASECLHAGTLLESFGENRTQICVTDHVNEGRETCEARVAQR